MPGLALVVAWSLFAFGGAYSWTLVPIAGGAVALAIVARPSMFARGTGLLDAMLVACAIIAAAQLVPLPQSVRLGVAPALAALDRAIYLDRPDPASAPPAPLTVDPHATFEAIALAVSGMLIFWSARSIFAGGALRRTVRWVAVCGFIASALAIVQHTTAPTLLYGIWRPINRGATPYTPFVNKNDLAAWLILAIPLTIGYLIARIDSRRRGGVPAPFAAILDDTTGWLTGGLTAMTAALLVSLSRSGLTAGIAATAVFLWLSSGRLSRRGRLFLLAGIVGVLALGLLYVNAGAALNRLRETIATGVGDRREIWSATRVMIRDFPVTGVGVGAYARAMTVYQPPHVFSFNHAHSEYLQVAAEGGLILSIAAGMAALAGAARVIGELRRDRTSMFFVRAGAASSIAAMAVQSIWETGLRMPANAVLFAICCAAAMYGTETEEGPLRAGGSATEPGGSAARDPVRVRER